MKVLKMLNVNTDSVMLPLNLLGKDASIVFQSLVITNVISTSLNKNKQMPFNIVLVEPEIPNNTGNIGRVSLASGSVLHLVKPFGFELSDARLKRAGLDYWKHITVKIYESLDEFLAMNKDKEMVFLSSAAKKSYVSIDYKDDLFFVFGKESVGLPKELVANNTEKLYKIPIHSPHVRSLNLANAVSIVVFEGLRSMAVSENG